jgi:transcriptional regulator with XRE-family HTH domain
MTAITTSIHKAVITISATFPRGLSASRRSYLSQLEKGGPFYASLKIVEKLAAVLEVEPAELLRLRPRRRSAARRAGSQ